MPQRVYSDRLNPGLARGIVGANSVAFAEGDAVLADGSGWLALATTSSRILGVCRQTVTVAATNQTVALVRPDYISHHGLLMHYGSDQATTQTDVGAYADFGTVTSAAFELNLVAGTSGQCFVLDFNFNAAAGTTTSDVIVEIAEPQPLAFAQA